MSVDANLDRIRQPKDACGCEDHRRVVEFAMKIMASIIVSVSLLWPAASYAIDFNDASTPIVSNGSDIRRVISGAALTGINHFGNPYVYTFNANGTISGIAGKHNQYDDRGRWSVEGNKLCTHWEIWGDGKKSCSNVSFSGERFRFIGEGGIMLQDSVIKRR